MTGDLREAARQLLSEPLVLASRDPEGHRRIRRHAEALTTMFRTYLGYRLVVDARFARLFKAGLRPGCGRPFLRSSKTPFSPRDYTYLALLCSVLLTTARRQVLLSNVVEEVRQAAADAAIDLGEDTRSERQALVHALCLLIEWGAVTEDAGSVATFAHDPAKQALLWIEPEIIRNLLSVPLREVDDPGELIRVASDPGADAVRHAVRRRLVEDPVVMIDQLSEGERAWLRQYQRREAQILEDNFGLTLEIRAEGVAAFDGADELTDLAFPRSGTLGQAALLTVSELVSQLSSQSSGSATVPIPVGLLTTIVDDLLGRYARRWSKDYVVEHPERLAPDVEDLLVDMGLVVRGVNGSLGLCAVAARYAPHPEEIDALPELSLPELPLPELSLEES